MDAGSGATHGAKAQDSAHRVKSATKATGNGATTAVTVPMERRHVWGSSRQEALDRVRRTLADSGKLSDAFKSYLGEMRADSPVESWDRLHFELNSLREADLAGRVAEICRDMRTNAWKMAKTDDDLLSHIIPMCDQSGYSNDDAMESLRFKLASMSDTVSDSIKPAEKMRAFMVNMARFGSKVDDRTILAVAEEIYVRRGHLGRLCDICDDILGFFGRDRDRMAASTLVEDIMGAVLAELQRTHVRAHASGVEAGLSPLVLYAGEHSPDKLLGRCAKLLACRAKSLKLAAPRFQRGRIGFVWASALAHRISARTQKSRPDEIVRYAQMRHPLSYKFLGLNRTSAISRLAGHGSLLAESASSAMALRALEGVRDPLPPGQDALALLESLLGHMERRGVEVGPAVMRVWRSGMLGSRLWGSLLEMEMRLRLMIVGADVLAVPAHGSRVISLELGGCGVEAYSPLDDELLVGGRDDRAGDPAPGATGDMFARARPDEGTGRTVVVVDCTMGASADLETTAGMLAPALDSARQPGALCLVRRECGRHEHALFKNSHSTPQVPDTVAGVIRRALDVDLAKPKNSPR